MPLTPVLAAHSLGCALVAQWAADRGGEGVAGAFLVPPSDVEVPDYPAEGRSFSVQFVSALGAAVLGRQRQRVAA